MRQISVRGARQHNLKNIDVDIPRDKITVVTGLSGSGKSSLAFDTLYAEGQRRYIESLSSYARQFLEQMERPDVDSIEGLSPAISIEQKTTSRNARSTVGTITEVYDYLRLLFASIGRAHCPRCLRPIAWQSVDQIVERVLELPENSRFVVMAPVVRERKGEFRKLFEKHLKMGFLRTRVDGDIHRLEESPTLDKRKNHTIEIIVDRMLLQPALRSRIEMSIRQALKVAGGLVTVAILGGPEILFSEKMACTDCGINVPTLEPRSFSFNSKFGACPACKGIGQERHADLARLVPNPRGPVAELELALNDRDFKHFFRESCLALLDSFKLRRTTPLAKFTGEMVHALVNGIDGPLRYSYRDFTYESAFQGVTDWLKRRIEATNSPRRRQQLLTFMRAGDCTECQGSRLRPESRSVQLNEKSISDYCRMPLVECLKAIRRIPLDSREELLATQLIREISSRLEFLIEVGLSYLTLDREAGSLSGGESQRIRLATQVGSKLRGVLYVLDEPSIGLHARDTHRLLATLRQLCNLGNTIVMVEHDEDTIRSADHLIDLGPGGGSHGGHLVAEGGLRELEANPRSLTGQYLKGSCQIPVPAERRRPSRKSLAIVGARHHNLKNVDITFPLGCMISVTGVSGSGKSSLVDEVLYRALSRHLYRSLLEPGEHDRIRGMNHIDKVIEIDQSPIGRTPRSNPATYTGLFTPLRELFALLPEAKIRGYKPGRFSFNVKGGRCEVCEGAGLKKIEMNFLPDVYVECDSCRRKRYNRETLAITYRGHSIADILDLNIEDAYPLLEHFPPIKAKLKTLVDVGLGYVRLGQSATTLSGGEAQRVKLAKELSRRATGRTLYILDEPTTGLHFEDVRKLLEILSSLVDKGNTVVVIEHNTDVILFSDWVIDLGPEGGQEGGQVVAEGTPEQISQAAESYTGQALRKLLVKPTRKRKSL